MSQTLVDFITFCHPPHLEKLHAPGVLGEIVKSHRYPFNEIFVIHQRCAGMRYRIITECQSVPAVVPTEEFSTILRDFGIKEDNPDAEHYTHGPNAAHYWKWHCINHLIGLIVTGADYVVFSDCDCIMRRNEPTTWIVEGMDWLEHNPGTLIVSPNDGGDKRLTRNVSQQLFLCNVKRMRKIDFDLPWNGKFDAPGGPMQEYYFMLEGRIGRYLTKTRFCRLVLGPEHRYWHHNPWEPEGWKYLQNG